MIHMLTQPLTTEEGFLNEACLNELEAWITNLPNTHERLAGEPEWEEKHWLSWRQIVGGLAYWAVRQIEWPDTTPFPPKLESVIGFFAAVTRPRFDKQGLAQLSLIDVATMLYEVLTPEPMFQAWNDAKVLKGWLDLDALICNICITIRTEQRAFDEFNRKFEAEHGPLAT